MTDYIIIAVLAVVLLVALRSGLKRLRGDSSCCSGGTYKAHSKKLGKVTDRKTFTVEGMHCQHCVNRVMEALNAIDGVSAVVHLQGGRAVVSSEQKIDIDVIRTAVEKVGYTVTGVR